MIDNDQPGLVRSATIRPGIWIPIHITGHLGPEGDTRMVTEVFHANEHELTMAVYDDGSVTYAGEAKDYPADGWRVRQIPYEDSTYQRTVKPDQAITDPRTEETRSLDLDAAEAGVRQAVEHGWVEVVGTDEHGRDVFRLTDAGRDHAARLLGIAPESII